MRPTLLFTILMAVSFSSLSSGTEGRPAPGSSADFGDSSPAFAPVEESAGLPRVLLIGDSISVGYTIGVRELLMGKANVHRIPENGGPTSRGVANIEAWLGDGHWDVIHFNWGLHDIKYMEDGKRQVSEDDYAANLRLLVKRMKETGATLIWCSTTPVPAGDLNPRRQTADVPLYNAIAREIMEEEGIAIDDLYAFVLPREKDLQIPVNVHFTEIGSAALAEEVATCIKRYLGEG
ncbi:MAG: SGNH/GDSL hydrolase family protein [Opitutaceae bacterium]